MFNKVLVANRGEIAVRAFRAAYELGVRTVAVFPYEDRNSEHRMKADEAYEIGERGHPVRAYLDPRAIVDAASAAGADAVYPGYGFLSENPELAEACTAAGITFVGPPARVLALTGNKATAVAAARRPGCRCSAVARPPRTWRSSSRRPPDVGFPLFVKAVAGGGGRGMRRVGDPAELTPRSRPRCARPRARSATRRCSSSARSSSRATSRSRSWRTRPATSSTCSSGTARCSAGTRRSSRSPRRRTSTPPCATGSAPTPSKFARAIGYVNAGTVEFLLDARGEHVFIEMNPRIQVEHTVTEEVTDVDLVLTQLRIAAGVTLADLGLTQDSIRLRGAAMQCRITTEDPANGFRPDTGRITWYRSPGGAGVRLDGGTTYTGAEISPHFDSLLAKLTCRGADFPTAVRRAQRALAEFRVRGVATNIQFLRAVLEDPDFRAGGVSTSFIDDRPDLVTAPPSVDRSTKLLTYLAEITVNQPYGRPPSDLDPTIKLPALDTTADAPAGSYELLREIGPDEFARRLRAQDRVAVTDTTFRDAHQSLLATRVRTRDLVVVAPYVARLTPQLWSVEAWGGATYDVALRFLHEDPWERLAAMREALPNVCLQMLIRGANTVGYTPYPVEVTDAFVAEAASCGIDVFRVFDSLNGIDAMRPAIDAVRATGTAIAEVALCYTGNLSDPSERLYTLDYYLRLAEQIVDAGAHVLAIKDMAGLLRAPAARRLVTALRERFDLPVHLHTHDTPGGQLATLLAAIDAGVDAVDAASSPMSGTTSQPALSALVAATDDTSRATGLDLDAICALEPYWEAVRRLYAPFESGLPAPTGRVYSHEIPGGQLSNLRQQAIALGLGEKFEEIEDTYAAANRILGNIVKVTPSSKVVGDLALHLVAVGADPEEFADNPQKFDIPDSVVGFLLGELGVPPGGWPEPFRTKALAGRTAPIREQELTAADRAGLADDPRATLNRLLFPGPTRECLAAQALYGDVSVLPTHEFLYGLIPGDEHAVDIDPGKRLIATVEAIGEADPRGLRTVMCTLNGQLRPVSVLDKSIAVKMPTVEKADPARPGHVAAPYAGAVTVTVAVGDKVDAGQTVATIEAMKMEASITAGVAGAVERVVFAGARSVDGGDLLLVIET